MILKEQKEYTVNVNFLKRLLDDIELNKTNDFSGIGIVLYEKIPAANLAPLKADQNEEGLPILEYDQILKKLLECSKYQSQFHDGFHLISSNLSLTNLSYYLSPPIINNIDYVHGARYRSAQLGSCLEGVFAIGIIGKGYSSKIFINGNIIEL